jgi:hypothetical protein
MIYNNTFQATTKKNSLKIILFCEFVYEKRVFNNRINI